MEVASQHCDTVPNKAKDILDTVNIERNVKHDSRAQHPVQSSVRGMLRVPHTFIFSLGKLRSIERFRTLKAKCRIGLHASLINGETLNHIQGGKWLSALS